MDVLMNEFNVLGDTICKPFAKFQDHPQGTKFKVVAFKKYTTKFGPTIVVESTDQMFNLPRRFEKLFDTDDKLAQWNAQNNLVITYNGIHRGITLVTIDKE